MSPILSVPFDQPEIAAEAGAGFAGAKPDAVLAVDDSGLELAALLRERLRLPGNPPAAVRADARQAGVSPLAAGERPQLSGFPCTSATKRNPRRSPRHCNFPVVVKARRLSASRGVIRADDAAGVRASRARVRGIQAIADRDAASLA